LITLKNILKIDYLRSKEGFNGRRKTGKRPTRIKSWSSYQISKVKLIPRNKTEKKCLFLEIKNIPEIELSKVMKDYNIYMYQKYIR